MGSKPTINPEKSWEETAHEWDSERLAAELRVEELEAAIDDYCLWEPGRRGHAEAHRMLLAIRRKDLP